MHALKSFQLYSPNVQPNQLNRDDDDGISKRAEEEESEREREGARNANKRVQLWFNYSGSKLPFNCRETEQQQVIITLSVMM